MSDTEYNKLKDAIANLRQSYEALKAIQAGEAPLPQGHDWESITQTAVVKCFDLCYEMLWKHLKKYLEESEQIPEVPNSPKGIFRMAQESNIIAFDTAEQLFKYNEIRNNAGHDYAHPKAKDVLSEIKNLIDDATMLYEIMAETE